MNNEVLVMKKEDQFELVMKENQVSAIQFNKEELIKRVDKILEQQQGIIYTEESIPEAKKVLANLRKQKKYLDAQRINACKPYEEVVKQAKMDMDDVLARYDKTIHEIDVQVKDYEAAWKQERKDYIEEIYKTFFVDKIPDQYRFYPMISDLKIDSKWMLKGTSKKKIKEQIIENREKLLKEVDTIHQLADDEFLSDVEAEYFKNLDLNSAIRKNEELRKAKLKVLETERKKKEEELRKKEENERYKRSQVKTPEDPFHLNFDSIPPIPKPINQRKSSISKETSINHSISTPKRTTKVKTLNIKIRGEESVLRDIMDYIYSKDIEILP